MNKKIRRAVRCFLIKENKIVAIQYKDENKKAGYYDIPGGKIEDGESPFDTAIREMKEETGIDILNLRNKGIMRVEYPDRVYIFHTFITNEYTGDPVEKEENFAEWIDIDELVNNKKILSNLKILEPKFIKALLDDSYIFNMNIEVNEEEDIINIENDVKASKLICTSNGITGTKFTKSFIDKNIKGKNIIIVDNATYETTNYYAREENKNKFIEYGAKKVELVTIDKNNLNEILKYDVCYVMGGSIANLLELVTNINIKEVIREFLKNGIYIGESSGSIILDKDVEWYFNLKRGTKPKYDRHFETYKGLGLIDEHIYPHYNKEKKEGINKIKNYNENITLLNDGDYFIR